MSSVRLRLARIWLEPSAHAMGRRFVLRVVAVVVLGVVRLGLRNALGVDV